MIHNSDDELSVVGNERNRDNQGILQISKNFITVLHIDDDEDFLILSKQIIEKISDHSIKVEVLNDPDNVFKVLDINKHNIIICDYEMPSQNGLTLFQKIRDNDIFIPIILFTARGREEIVIQALNLGVDYYIKKKGKVEIMFSEVVHAINSLYNKYKLEKLLNDSKIYLRNKQNEKFTILRDEAEKMTLDLSKDIDSSYLSSLKTLHEMIHELEIHQIELEIQNSELVKTRNKLNYFAEKFSDLYNYTPCGYITLNDKSEILEINIKAKEMLNITDSFIHKKFTEYVCKDDQESYHIQHRKLFKQKRKTTFRIKLIREDKTLFQSLIEAIVLSGFEDDNYVCRMFVIELDS